MKNFTKIDTFYIVLVTVMIAIAILVAVTFRGIFSALNKAEEFVELDVKSELVIEKEKIDKALTNIFTN